MASIVTTDAWVPLYELMAYCNAGPERTREFEHLLNAVTDAIQSELDRKILTRAYADEVTRGSGECALFPRQWPVTTLTTVEFLQSYTNTDETWQVFHPSPYTCYVEQMHKRWIYFRGMAFPRGEASVRLSYTAGYSLDGAGDIPKVPQDLRWAVKETALEWFKQSDLQIAGLSSVRGPMGETTTYRDRHAIPRHVMEKLDAHRRMVV